MFWLVTVPAADRIAMWLFHFWNLLLNFGRQFTLFFVLDWSPFGMFRLEMQSSGPAARPGPKFRPGRAFCGSRTRSAGLMPGSGKAVTMHYALAAGLRAVLGRCWPGSMLDLADFVRCRSGLEFGFRRNFCTSSSNHCSGEFCDLACINSRGSLTAPKTYKG